MLGNWWGEKLEHVVLMSQSEGSDANNTNPTKGFLHPTLSICENTLPQGGEQFHY